MTGGSTSRSAGVLSRAAELEQLRAAAAMHRQLDQAKRELESRGPGAGRRPVRAGDGGGQRRQAEDEVLRLEGTQNHYDILLRSLRENLENPGGRAGEPDRPSGRQRPAAGGRRTVPEQEAAAAQYRAQAEEASPASRSCWSSPTPWRRRSAAKSPSGRPGGGAGGHRRSAAELRRWRRT